MAKVGTTQPEKRRHGRRPDPRWDAADWSLSDAEIARRLGTTRAAANVQRQRRGLGSSRDTHTAAHFRAWVTARRDQLHGLTSCAALAAFAAATGLAVNRDTAREILRAAGVRPARPRGPKPPSRMTAANWDLPNGVLAAVWGMALAAVATRRCRLGLPSARWDLRRGPPEADPAYRAAVAAERRKAGKVAAAAAAGA